MQQFLDKGRGTGEALVMGLLMYYLRGDLAETGTPAPGVHRPPRLIAAALFISGVCALNLREDTPKSAVPRFEAGSSPVRLMSNPAIDL